MVLRNEMKQNIKEKETNQNTPEFCSYRILRKENLIWFNLQIQTESLLLLDSKVENLVEKWKSSAHL